MTGFFVSNIRESAIGDGFIQGIISGQLSKTELIDKLKNISHSYLEELPENHKSFAKPAVENIIRRFKKSIISKNDSPENSQSNTIASSPNAGDAD